ncbi:hypothetical protein FTO68_06235 [Methanocalculus taiwanensis]|uniref:Uncharacterized protein n=1 Tax=Methanocalculus taiwanensis TaxID=106207 RepID=A0ABD4TKW0_9EURY|nr:hypothetical protein [Methanocalculus taiwanensis]MCQ1538583.1 hypothetical protein [Methanocalculus taiwanensis]
MVKDASKTDNTPGSGPDGISVSSADPVDPSDPGILEGDTDNPIVAGEKEVSILSEIPAASGVSGSPLEEEIDPGHPPGPSPVPAAGLGGGLWIGLVVLVAGVVSALWYLYQKKSLAEDLEEAIPDRSYGGDGDLYGRGRAAYRGRA